MTTQRSETMLQKTDVVASAAAKAEWEACLLLLKEREKEAQSMCMSMGGEYARACEDVWGKAVLVIEVRGVKTGKREPSPSYS